jgi:hypothetical protein
MKPLETVDEPLDRPVLRKQILELHAHAISAVILMKSKNNEILKNNGITDG